VRWTRKSIIAEIKRLHSEGERLNYSAAEANHLNLVRAAAWHYGTWRRAIETAGIDYEGLSRYQRWNKQRIIERIQELHKQGADLSWRSVSTELDPSLAAAALRPNGFSSWREAVIAAGIDVEEVTRYKYWDNEKVLKAIKARKRNGEPMSSKSLQTTDQSLFCAARRRFGSWDGALEAAGYNADKIRLRRHNPAMNERRGKGAAAEEEVVAAKPAAKKAATKAAAPAKKAAVKATAKAPAKAVATKAPAKATAKKAATKAVAPAKATKAAAKPAAKAPAKAAAKKVVATKAVATKAPAKTAAKATVKAPAKKAAVKAPAKAAAKAPAKAAVKAPAKAAATRTAAKAAAPAKKAAVKAPAKAAVKAAAKAAATKSTKAPAKAAAKPAAKKPAAKAAKKKSSKG